MASPRIILLVGFLIFQTVHAFATGGGDDYAPPTLDYYLQRLPAKSISQILKEDGMAPKTDSKSVIDQNQLRKDFAAGPSPALVEKIDHLLIQARSAHSPPAEINLLQDLRDLAGSQATATEVKDYVNWRLDHLGWFSALDCAVWDKPEPDPARIAEIDAKISSSSQALLPYWLYLKGALYYKEGNDTDSETCFDRVLKEFPECPRAETALFMKGRCRLSQSVDDGNKDDAKTAIREQAKQLFEDYLNKYPQGRYCNDVRGWLGGAAYRSGDYAGAIPYFIQQTENKVHPEDFLPAIIMIEKCLYHLRDCNSSDIDHIAQHPPVAMALAYFAINSPETDRRNDDGDNVNFRSWRTTILPKLATAVAAEKNRYQGLLGQNRYLAILAHAASDQGNQDEAMKILNMGNKAEENDDFAFVHAFVLQRAGKLDQAVGGYRDFLKRFPGSALAPGARFRLSLALHDQKKDGEALLELASLRNNHLPVHFPVQTPAEALAAETREAAPSTITAIDMDYTGASDPQIDQTMDALLNYAPIRSLETALKGSDKEHEEFRKDLRDVLRERSLAQEDFTGAAVFTDSPDEKKALLLRAKQANTAKKAKGETAAKQRLQIGNYWASQAKLPVVLPLDGDDTREYLFHDDAWAAGSKRKINGSILSLPNLDQELENRNQWTHAIAWWGKSVESDPTNALAPQALWKAIQAQKKSVEVSTYTQQRAAETHTAIEARKEYDALVSRYPNSEEAKKYAVFWNFPTQEDIANAQENGWHLLAYRGNGCDEENWLKALKYSDDYGYSSPNDNWGGVCKDLEKLSETSRDMDAKAFESKVTSLLQTARAMVTGMDKMPVINCLEDLKQVSLVPSLDSGIRAEYVKLRFKILLNTVLSDIDGFSYGASRDAIAESDDQLRNEITDLGNKPDAASIHDFIDFLNLAVTANHLIDISATGLKQDGDKITYGSRDFPLLSAQADTFLKKYPASPKREAAAALRIRGLTLASFPKKFRNTLPWPDANSWSDDDSPLYFQRVPFDAPAFEKSLKSYYEEFPQGQYQNAVLSYRADVALMNGQWSDLLDDLLALRNQKNNPEFQEQIARQLSELFEKLYNDEQRDPILQEILKRPDARELLQTYLTAGGLPYLKDYLTDRLKNS